MKYILILLVSFAFGQVDLPISVKDIKVRPLNTTVEYEYETAITVEYLMQYAEECYNDSTYVTSEKVLYIKGKFVTTQYWAHKEPTLKGFIRWVKRVKK